MAFTYDVLEGHASIRLVTILSGTDSSPLACEISHVTLDTTPPYECLSYVWGDPTFNAAITLNKSAFSVTGSLYTALIHLRHATEQRVMWIDALCINQSDIAERNAQVAKMKEIYAYAKKVIIWIGEPDEESERAVSFLKEMAAHKKWTGRHTWIGRGDGASLERRGSDTSSELGRGQMVDSNGFLAPPSVLSQDEHAGSRDPEGELDGNQERHDGGPSASDSKQQAVPEALEDRNPLFLGTGPDEGDVETQPRLSPEEPPLGSLAAEHSSEQIHLSQLPSVYDQPGEELTPRRRIGLFFQRIIRKTRTDQQRRISLKRWIEYGDESEANRKRELTTHIATGIPVLYENDYYSFFAEARAPDWAALDSLLTRPWWSRVWVVQEVWNASDAILQCGHTTMKWKTFQKAMDYSEEWDDMGDSVSRTKRGAEWLNLRRRYTLAIHISKQRLKGTTQSSLLWNTWDRESTDPRDKVFAVQALVAPENAILPPPDYSKSTREVYCEVARAIVEKQKQMDILLAANGTARRDGLPSWVPDWRRDANEQKPTLLVNRSRLVKLYFGGSMDKVVMYGHSYNASGDSEPVASFSGDVMVVSGIEVGSIAEVAPVANVGVDVAELIDASSKFIHQSEYTSKQEKSKEKVVKTLAAGDVSEREQDKTIQNVMRQRRMFATQDGSTGIGYADTKEGDKLFIISGCNFPIVLRPEGDTFAVVGEAYVSNIMNGEALGKGRPSFLRRKPRWQNVRLL